MNIRLSDHFTYRRLLRFVLPSIGMMLVTSVYSIVDGFFVSNFVGKNAFAAVNLVMPVLMALGSFGFMIGTGGSALVAKTLGEGDRALANRIFTMLIRVILLAGVACSVLGFLFMRPIALALGASEAILEDCVLYGRILLISNTPFMLLNAFQSFFVTAEKPSLGLAVTALAGGGNMVLDFLFIYVLRMGLFGAAVATALSEYLGGIVCLCYFARPNTSLLRFVKTDMEARPIGQACFNGSSEMLSSLSSSFVGILYNLQLIRLAAENGIAAYGVLMYVNFVFMACFIGYAMGSAPVVSFHYGAGNHAELKSLFRKSLAVVCTAGVAMTAAAILLAEPLARLFVGYDAELMALTVNGLRYYSLSFLLSGFNIFGSAFFTALNNGPVSALISFSRTMVLEVAAILILPKLFGIDGVWLAVVVADGITLLLTSGLLLAYRKKYRYA